MKKLLMGLAIALIFFVLMIVLFFVFFLVTSNGEMLAEGEGETLSSKEMQAIIQERDSLLVDLDSIQSVLAHSNVALDSLEQELTFESATARTLERRLQEKDAEIESLRRVDVNAQDMARTFATMTVAELIPIVAKLSDDVVMDIYKHTTSKRKKFLLAALGDDRAATLTNRLVKRKGS
ncbi:MAG: hypothetical protein JSU77_12170 [Fidelibacterota bacterium]|nr:MAG: hypothetical protein JSU77_12170 [Candidatus Neomarinimicrobiota bacterium]